MTRLRPLILGVSLAALSTSAFAQTAPSQEEIDILREQVRALSARLENLEARADAIAAPVSAATLPIQTLPPPAPAAPPAPAVTAIDWSTGIPEFRSPDGSFTFKPRFRVTTDLSTTTGSSFADRNITGTELRGLRIGGQGKLAGGFSYWVEADFADNAVNVNNAFLGWSRKVAGRDLDISLGQRLNDRGVEGGTAEDQSPFLERSQSAAVLGPERGGFGLGVTTKVTGSVWHASLAVTGDAISNGVANDSVSAMARVHYSAFKTDRGFLHLGGWGFVEDIASGTTSVTRSNIVASRFNDNLRLSTGTYAGPRSSTGYGLELGGVQGPGWLMIEGGVRSIDTMTADYDQEVASASVGFFLTGETPPLSTRTGTWARPKVLHPVGSGGYGGLELVGRYDHGDYSDNPTGGEGDIWLAGGNWYPTTNTRVSVQWSHWSIDNRTGVFIGEDSGDTVTARVQAAF